MCSSDRGAELTGHRTPDGSKGSLKKKKGWKSQSVREARNRRAGGKGTGMSLTDKKVMPKPGKLKTVFGKKGNKKKSRGGPCTGSDFVIGMNLVKRKRKGGVLISTRSKKKKKGTRPWGTTPYEYYGEGPHLIWGRKR